MTDDQVERQRRLKALFEDALESSSEEREVLLRQKCAGDTTLFEDVLRLLADDERLHAAPKNPEQLPQFGLWKAIRELGRGGMGVVYLAERADGAFRMKAAVKVVPLALASFDIEGRFRRERQFLASLDHPKIARLIDGGTHAGVPYLVMEYVDGLPIDRYCETHGLGRRARIGLVRQVLEALIYVHGQQVIHRDLKSSNILVDAAGNARLLDFGTARLVDPGGDTTITRTGVFAFTPECASPEQMQGKPLTFASDIYSAGVLLYRLLIGRPPFLLPDDAVAIADIIIHQEAEAPGLDRSLDAILLKALRKNPAERYQSAAELDADLARYLEGRPVRARRPRKVGLLVVTVVSVSVCAGAGWIAAAKPGGVAQFLPWAHDRYVISTVAGSGRQRFVGSGAPALYADLVSPQYLAADSTGNIFVTDVYFQQVFRISPDGIIKVYAGTGQDGFSGDNGPATAANLSNPQGLAVDSAGNLFIMDNGNARLRKVTRDGIITSVAQVDGGSLASDAEGNLYTSQLLANVIHRVTPQGVVSTFAGTGKAGSEGDGGQAIDAKLFHPDGLKFDAAGNLYVVDTGNNKVRKITPQGIISTIAGNGKSGFSGDGGSAIDASLEEPSDVVPAADGSIYIADKGNSRIRVVSPRGIISTFAGGITGGPLGTLHGYGPASEVRLQTPIALVMDPAGALVVAVKGDRQIRRISSSTITTIAGVLPRAEVTDNMPAISARLLNPGSVAVSSSGEIYITDGKDNRIREISRDGIITTFAGNGLPGQSPDGSRAEQVGEPRMIAFDTKGNLYVALASSIVRKIAPDGTVRTVAGSTPGFAGDHGPAILAQLSHPAGLAADEQGNLYIADSNNNRIRRVDAASGNITTIAGTGVAAYSGDNGPATSAALCHPYQLAMDRKGNLYVADTGNSRIRMISTDGTITSVAGNGISGAAGDGGNATAAQLYQPSGVAVDLAGNLYICAIFGPRIRKVDAATYTITTIEGTGLAGFKSDGGLGTGSPQTIAVDGAGNIYLTDTRSRRVRKLTPAQPLHQ